ncbi:MAG TPA: DnaB-like helicase C-terminal domain-containing protein [Gemmatimonadaceae bacterium]|jgi:replicative DNA helicase|nr:DnaB-like helicase C-terminal domain-containing protein [Gemmatimonadaceae bacterium]
MSDLDEARARRAIGTIIDGGAPRDTIPTGFPSLDNALGGGVRRRDLVILGGEVGSGKSALALAIALRASEAGAKVRFLSAEMDQTRAAERALAIEARVRVDDLRRGNLDTESRSRLEAAARRVEQQFPTFDPLLTSDTGALEHDVRLQGVDLVVIDPLQALATGGRPLDEEMASAARALKRLAVERDVCVVATSGLPQIVRDRKDLRPQLDDFGALGAPKQFADVVLGLYRQEMYDSAPDVDGATELLVLKNRNGSRGYVDLFFYKQWMRFEDMLEPDR